jgi:CDP-diacylglycerol---serine O-phosphatidyltransferase
VEQLEKKKKKRSYIPSIITLMNLAAGFIAILLGDHYWSSICLCFSLLFDVLDGFVARKLNAQSELGRELDSLADLTSFGVAPAYLYYLLAPMDGIVAMIPPTMLVVASAFRLAKFNLLPSSPYFSGLPTPANGIFMIGLFLAYHNNSSLIADCFQNEYLYFIVPFIFAGLMVSNLRMTSLKGLSRKDMKQNLVQIIMLVTFIVMLLLDNKLATPVMIIVYIVLSILQSLAIKA